MRLEPLGARRQRGRGLKTFGIFLSLAAVIAAGLVLLRTGSTPELSLEVGLPAIGPQTPFTVTAKAEKRGLTELEVRLRQGDAVVMLHRQTFVPRPSWAFWGPMTPELTLPLELTKDQLPAVRAETATIEVIAKGAPTALLGAPTSSVAKTLEVRLQPPRLAVLSENVFVAQGGSEAVAYVVGETAVRHGVRAGDYEFAGYPLPGGAGTERFAFFAVPYDMADTSDVVLFAEDDVGNVATAPFIDQFTPRPFKTDTIKVTDGFMEVVVPRILAKTPELADQGSLLKNYVHINSELRRQNGETLVGLAQKSEPELYWQGAFVQMPAKVVSAFADRRTYLYEGKKIDRQDHLGFDLASVKKAPVPAANGGKVIFSGYLGIYGNTIVLDHGYGLQSLYAHLSKMEVEVGDRVEKGQTIARTGATGLALGDHLHFTLLLGGLPVTPLEWWDGHWVHDRIALKLGDWLAIEAD